MSNNNLKVIDLLSSSDPKQIDSFNNSVQSTYTINSNIEKYDADFEWLEIMEGTIRYLDNILRNPNRFIVNEEEVVNVEKAKRITIDSIKHLAKNTNFIQEIDANGDVRPSKILNINKDEDYNTYENRVIYTLIRNMQTFVALRKKDSITASYEKSQNKSEYRGVTRVGSEAIDINVSMVSRSNISKRYGNPNDMSVEQRIERLELQISDLTNTEVFKALRKANVARVIPPIKKTNLILKNTNFQYAMKLWNYLQTYREGGNKAIRDNIVYKDDNKFKELFDDIFLLNYLAVDSLKEGKKDPAALKESKEAIETLTNNMITKIVEINSDLSMDELQKVIGEKIAVIRNKKEASLEEVQKKFNSLIQSTISKIYNFKFRSLNEEI